MGKDRASFADRLTALMEERTLGVREAARAAGVSSSVISSWRTGTHAPTDFVAAQRLAHALGVSLSFLLTGEDDTRPDGPPSLLEVLESTGEVHSGIYRLTLERLVPRKQNKRPSSGADGDDHG